MLENAKRHLQPCVIATLQGTMGTYGPDLVAVRDRTNACIGQYDRGEMDRWQGA